MARDNGLGKKLLLSILLFLFWVALTATLALYDLVLGAICAAFVAVITVSLLGRALNPRITPAVLLRLPVFTVRLVWEIIKANYDVAKIILTPRLPIDPRIVEYRTYLPDDLPRTVFSDSITLTPGTVTVELEEDLLKVHCLCPYHEEGLAGLEKMVAWLFGVKKEVPTGSPMTPTLQGEGIAQPGESGSTFAGGEG
ncbi:MAG: Na+/H+ antiporter subunit E [Actinobacteria bacterium]|nr:Na+/H+ antiporter subunit E [Actinomycetota bacterium]